MLLDPASRLVCWSPSFWPERERHFAIRRDCQINRCAATPGEIQARVDKANSRWRRRHQALGNVGQEGGYRLTDWLAGSSGSVSHSVSTRSTVCWFAAPSVGLEPPPLLAQCRAFRNGDGLPGPGSSMWRNGKSASDPRSGLEALSSRLVDDDWVLGADCVEAGDVRENSVKKDIESWHPCLIVGWLTGRVR